MVNRVIIMGRLTADPEYRTAQTGTAVARFRVAVDRIGGGEQKTDFIDVTAWKGTADFVNKYFRKGSMIAVDGSLRAEQYEDREGNKRKAVYVAAQNVSFCGDKPTDQEQTRKQESVDVADDDMPF